MTRRVGKTFNEYIACIKHFIVQKTHLANDTRLRNAAVRAVNSGKYEVDGE